MSVERQVNFAGIVWHAESTETYEKFYLRGFVNGREASQDTPVFNDVAGWQLYHGPRYNGAIDFGRRRWVHIRLAVSGDRAEVYVDDVQKPLVFIDDLRLDHKGGKLGSDGAIDTNASHRWTNVTTEPTGLLNIGRAHPVTVAADTVFVRAVIDSDREQTKRLRLGFSEQIVAYLHGQPLYSGTDIWHDHDVTFQGVVGFWDALYVPLRAGPNELWFAVTENTQMRSGWGVLAAFDDLDGIAFQTPKDRQR